MMSDPKPSDHHAPIYKLNFHCASDHGRGGSPPPHAHAYLGWQLKVYLGESEIEGEEELIPPKALLW